MHAWQPTPTVLKEARSLRLLRLDITRSGFQLTQLGKHDGASVHSSTRSFEHVPFACVFTMSFREGVPRHAQKQCEPGFFCVGGVRYPCAAGRYGTNAGSATPGCDGRCQAGYWCESSSTSPTQHKCGSANVYCPEGTVTPLPVDDGSYTVGPTEDARVKQRPCEPGHWCQNGQK